MTLHLNLEDQTIFEARIRKFHKRERKVNIEYTVIFSHFNSFWMGHSCQSTIAFKFMRSIYQSGKIIRKSTLKIFIKQIKINYVRVVGRGLCRDTRIRTIMLHIPLYILSKISKSIYRRIRLDTKAIYNAQNKFFSRRGIIILFLIPCHAYIK